MGFGTGEKREYDRFLRKLNSIKNNYKKDKYFDLKSIALDRTFFCQDGGEQPDLVSKKRKLEESSRKSGQAERSPISFFDKECQTGSEFLEDFENSLKYASFCLEESKEKNRVLQASNKTLSNWKRYHNAKNSTSDKARDSLRKAKATILRLERQGKLQKIANSKLKSLLVEVKDERDALQAQLDSRSDLVSLKDGKSYSNKAVFAVIALKQQNVADSKVGEVMKIVGEMLGIQFESVPSASTVRNIQLSSLYLGRKHVLALLSESIENGENLCLASDETTKGTVKLQAYGYYDNEKHFTCLGIEQVAEKSAQTAVDTLKNSVNQLPGAPSQIFEKFLCKVSCTISDSAQTEQKFNKLIDSMRREIVPELVEGFTNLSDEEKTAALNFSNYFCQLHIISNYTKIVLKSLLEHEVAFKRVEKLEEPTVFFLIKLVSQMFCRKSSGCHQHLASWITWCSEKKLARFVFESFIGNRFNIVFFLASRVFFHRKHLIDFIEDVGEGHPELSKVRSMLLDPMIVAHLQVLGFCDQLVTGPLWRLSENCKHVLDTCDYSLKLKSWLEECIEFPASFFDGVSPVPNLQVESPTTSALLFNELKSLLPSKEAQDAAGTVSCGSLEYFCSAFESFLPEGEFSKNADLIRDTTKAAPATNKDIESVFGVISHIFETKPNMRLNIRIAQTLMTKNHTLNWLRSLTENEFNEYLNESRKARGQLKIEGEEGAQKIGELVLALKREKSQQAAAKKYKNESKKERSTMDMVRDGYWLNDVDNQKNLANYSSEKQKRDAVVRQLNFRKKVLNQPAPYPKFFTLTVDRKPLPFHLLLQKLQHLQRQATPGSLLYFSSDEYVGKKFGQKVSGSVKSGFVEDISVNRRGVKLVTLQYNDETSIKMSFEQFEEAVESQSIMFY
ncbi:hypothetical protein CAEBREN_10612 [Caenorhabditis brenneri]|uniref:Uncharacterized protein n=1 Tax=Caenorhabditis brenneri TaxID=135651 RepID=G0P6J2_CAEBE|nr:hypothetical protein CAEBREN_10612 [Caenorhabditis brenneri]